MEPRFDLAQCVAPLGCLLVAQHQQMRRRSPRKQAGPIAGRMPPDNEGGKDRLTDPTIAAIMPGTLDAEAAESEPHHWRQGEDSRAVGNKGEDELWR
jgi:hypothetical protein